MTAVRTFHPYQPPTVRVLGRVQEITQLRDKKFGPTDGFTFQGVAITDASP